MGTEIERKFLLSNDNWRADAVRSVRSRQGYLCNSNSSSVRVRVMDGEARINIKSMTLGIRRTEFEYVIPMDDAEHMLENLCPGQVEKTRYYVPVGNHTWEIDVFEGDNDGLVVAEIELDDEDELFERPAWVGEEVSHEPCYYNILLIDHPYCNW